MSGYSAIVYSVKCIVAFFRLLATLELQVLEARSLPDTDTFFLSKLVNRKDVTDPYVSGYLDTTKVMIDDDDEEAE